MMFSRSSCSSSITFQEGEHESFSEIISLYLTTHVSLSIGAELIEAIHNRVKSTADPMCEDVLLIRKFQHVHIIRSRCLVRNSLHCVPQTDIVKRAESRIDYVDVI